MAERILIIGGAGYIGTMLTRRLVQAGDDVTIYDNKTYGSKPLQRLDLIFHGASLSDVLQADLTETHPKPQDYNFIEGDTRDIERVREVVGDGFTYVFHFGELVGINACEADPRITRAVNYEGTRNVVDGVLASPHQPRLVWNSSSSIYHISPDGTDFKEDSPLPELGVLDQYCQNKIFSEKYIGEKSDQSRDFEFVVLRPATVGGLSPRMRIDLLPNHIAYSFLTQGLFALSHPEDCRAVIDVGDLTDLYLSLVNTSEWSNGVFNVGFLNGSKKDYVEGICSLVGLGNEAIRMVPQVGDLRNLTISSDLLAQTYGFSPRRGLADMMGPVVALVKDNPLVFSSVSRDPLLVDHEFTNTPPEEFRKLLLVT